MWFLFVQDKERALQVSNIYSLRAKPNVEKSPGNSKTNSSTSRKLTKKFNKPKPTSAKLPCQPLAETTEIDNKKPKSAGFINNSGTDTNFHNFDETKGSANGLPDKDETQNTITAKSDSKLFFISKGSVLILSSIFLKIYVAGHHL